jgi:DNA polymerase-3 subunit gamma/tau
MPDNDVMELFHKYRPTKFSEMIGQSVAVKELQGFAKKGAFPHAIMLIGGSGCGKTTAARIIRYKLNPHITDAEKDPDYKEINCAKDGSIDMVRDIQNDVRRLPMYKGGSRIWYLDEFQSLSRAGFAQQALLKLLEDTPRHVYFLVAATDPDKIIKAIRTRCTTINFAPMTAAAIRELVESVAGKEGKKLPDKVLTRVVECADGSARLALNILNKLLNLDNEADQIAAVVPEGVAKQADELVRLLVWQPNVSWKDIAAVLKDVTDEPEQLRRRILAVARAELLKANPKTSGRAYALICAFEGHFFDSGTAGLARAAYEVFSDK